jgi:DNA helicase HerA-like ATPase
LELNDTQASVISLIFKYCDDHSLPLLDLKDFKKVLQFLTNEGKEEIEKQYGNISSASTGTIMRKVIELEEQGAERFFGERSFDVEDLLRTNDQGRGYIHVLRLMDLQSKPKLFSTFMLCLLAEIYEKFPEEGDVEKPKLVVFIDEAHLIFREASKALLEQIEMIIKLIRSKGVGIYFCTQNPIDIPNEILAQLGMKVQHALRAFTAQDRKAIKMAAENYPLTDFYKVDQVITSLGTGEALVTVLDEKGAPTPLAHTLLCSPESRMDTISDQELSGVISKSHILSKYDEVIDRESAYEMLNAKLDQASQASKAENEGLGKVSVPPPPSRKVEKSTLEKISKNTMVRQAGRTFVREVTRGILGVLGLGTRRRSPRRSGWF